MNHENEIYQESAPLEPDEAGQLEQDDQKIDFTEALKERPIMLVDQTVLMTLENIQSLAPEKNILFCDANIEEIEKDSTRIGPAFKKENILNLDHHVPLKEMSRQISSTNLAIEFVQKYGPVAKDVVTIINHTDCDSILSSAIMRGIIPPLDEFGTAAIAADHTGEILPIADLLQSLNPARDIELSLRNLQLFLEGKEIEPRVKKLLGDRLNDRERAKEMVSTEFQSTSSGLISFAELDKKIDAGLLPALMPEAKIIVIFSPLFDKNTREKLPQTEVKIRLGESAPAGTDLREIMAEVDPNWGGRWNAGSNKRKGGTEIDREIYIQKLDEIAKEYFNQEL